MTAYKKPGLLAQDRADGNKHDEIITQPEEFVKTNWLKDFHVRHQLQRNEIIEAIRSFFPGFDKAMLSKCEHPEKYGIQLSDSAKQILIDKFERSNKP